MFLITFLMEGMFLAARGVKPLWTLEQSCCYMHGATTALPPMEIFLLDRGPQAQFHHAQRHIGLQLLLR